MIKLKSESRPLAAESVCRPQETIKEASANERNASVRNRPRHKLNNMAKSCGRGLELFFDSVSTGGVDVLDNIKS
jgi:hypothetical protein